MFTALALGIGAFGSAGVLGVVCLLWKKCGSCGACAGAAGGGQNVDNTNTNNVSPTVQTFVTINNTRHGRAIVAASEETSFINTPPQPSAPPLSVDPPAYSSVVSA